MSWREPDEILDEIVAAIVRRRGALMVVQTPPIIMPKPPLQQPPGPPPLPPALPRAPAEPTRRLTLAEQRQHLSMIPLYSIRGCTIARERLLSMRAGATISRVGKPKARRAGVLDGRSR